MSFVSIIRPEHPESPADIGIERAEIQEKRTDPETMILREFIKAWDDNFKDKDKKNESMNEYSEKLSITPKELIHKVEYMGLIEDDEREWREEKYGKH